jgi:hypothetical protein
VAYRQLCAVTLLALGMVASACGGGAASSTSAPSTDVQPPGNSDQAPGSASDQAPKSSDQAPASADAAPGSSNDPAGTGASGNVGALCQQVCGSVTKLANDCSDGMSKLEGICSQQFNCKVPAGFPCTSELGAFLGCFFDNLSQICKAAVAAGDAGGTSGVNPAPQGTDAFQCADSLKALGACAEANHVNMSTMQMPNPQQCVAGSCDGCTSDCTKCTCQAGTDLTKLAMCAQSCATP